MSRSPADPIEAELSEAQVRERIPAALLPLTEGIAPRRVARMVEVHLITGSFRPSPGAARGSERWIRIHRHATTAACLEQLQARGFRVYAADLHPQALSPEQVPVDGPVALLFGAELSGVSEDARALVDGYVILPMFGFVESLNVSVAAALITRAVADRRRAVVGTDLSEAAKGEALATWLGRESTYKAAAKVRSGG